MNWFTRVGGLSVADQGLQTGQRGCPRARGEGHRADPRTSPTPPPSLTAVGSLRAPLDTLSQAFGPVVKGTV
jgi:hypothetical protein